MKTFIITFTDGTVFEIKGDRTEVRDGVLHLWEESTYSSMRLNSRHFPLANIREWRVKE